MSRKNATIPTIETFATTEHMCKALKTLLALSTTAQDFVTLSPDEKTVTLDHRYSSHSAEVIMAIIRSIAGYNQPMRLDDAFLGCLDGNNQEAVGQMLFVYLTPTY